MEEMIMAQRKTLNEKIEIARLESEQKEKELKELLKKKKEEDRKARNHRLCERGGKVEKVLPDLIRLTEDQFEIFVQKTLLTGFAARILKELLPPEPVNEQDGVTENGNNADSKPAEAMSNINISSDKKPAEPIKATTNSGFSGNRKPTEAAHTGGAGSGVKSEEPARVAS
jgi:hypothetical protein